jgi:hypothetical protein
MSEESKELTREEKRALRKAELAKLEEVQRQIDLEAIDDLEVQHGDSNIAVLRVPHTPNLPVLVAGGAPRAPAGERVSARV